MKQGNTNKNSRSKRSLLIINLVETPAGYSIIEGTDTFNRNPNAQPPSNPITYSQAPIPPTKEQKMVVKQNNLLLLKAPTRKIETTSTGKMISSTPTCASSFAKWFSLSTVHETERHMVKIWVMEDHPSMSPEQVEESAAFQAALEKYEKQRNLIIEVYGEKYGPTNQYMSASALRKHICDDAYWLMRLHTFLNSEGIINSSYLNLENEQFLPGEIFRKNVEDQTYEVILPRKYLANPFKQYPDKGFLNEKNQALKKITNDIRPYCDYCGIHCGVVWFQHLRIMDPKEISSIMKNVNSKNPPLSEKEYEIILCTKCYCNGSFPLLLTHHDFRKVSINDKLEPDRKKKTSKHKRKEEKRKRKEKQMQEQNEEERGEEEDAEPNANSNGKPVENEKQEEEEDQSSIGRSSRKRNRLYTNEAMRLASTTPAPTPVQNAAPENNVTTAPDNTAKVQEMIKDIVSKVREPKTWSFQETLKLLELVQVHGENWDLIHKNLTKAGLCYNKTPEDLIEHFLTLPKLDLTQIHEQYSSEQFVSSNRNIHKSHFLTKLAQNTLDTAVQLVQKLPAKPSKSLTKKENRNKNWKALLNSLTKLEMRRIEQQIELTEKIQKTAVEMGRYCEDFKRDLQEQ